MPKFVSLNRTFFERETYSPEELATSEVVGKRVDWAGVLNSRVAVIVAPANFGKTTEMLEQAKQRRGESGSSVFVALRGMADRGSFENALEATERAAYNAWKAAPDGELTLFVDSLDEAAAGARDGIEYLVGEIAHAVSWPNERIRWVISTRPAVLTDRVLEKLDQILVVPLRSLQVVTPEGFHGDKRNGSAAHASMSAAVSEPAQRRVFSMSGLTNAQGEAYLRAIHPSENADALLSMARQRGLSGFTTSPGGLDILAAINLVRSPPGSLTEVFSRVANAVQALRGGDSRLDVAGGSDAQSLIAAVQKLASASQACQLLNIELPEAVLGVPEQALSARLIATPMVSERVLSQLLNSQLFIDVSYHQVKLYPDELVPFLAAQRLSSIVQGPDQARRLIEHFTWAAPSGERGVYRQFLPLMGWLATLNVHCRELILERDPQAVAFFGDLRNPSMARADAEIALEESIRRLVEQGDRLGRGMFTLTSENFWQAGHPRLFPHIQGLFDRYGSHDWVRDALLDIVTACRSDALRGRVLKEQGNDYSRLLTQSIAVRYLLELGDARDLAGFAAAIKRSETASERMVATLIGRLGWKWFTSKEVSQLVIRQFEMGSGGFRIGYVFEHDDLLCTASDSQLYELARALVLRAAQLRGHGKGRPRTNWKGTDRFVEMTMMVLATMIRRDVASKSQQLARLCSMLQRVFNEYVATSDTNDLRNALLENTPVRRALLRITVERARGDAHQLRVILYATRLACPYTAEDVETLRSPSLSQVAAELDAARRHRPEAPAARMRRARRLKVGTQAKNQLLANLASLRDGTAISELAWVARWLSQTDSNARYGEVNFAEFTRAAGREIADAVRKGLGRLWRTTPPKFDERDVSSTYYITAAGLQGLHIELGEGEHLPVLDQCEVRAALRYGVFEINAYPKWYWKLAQAHPQVAQDELAKMIGEAGNGAVSRAHAEQLLSRLDEAPADIAKGLAPLAWKFLTEQKPTSEYVIQGLLHTACKWGAVPQSTFEGLAIAKMKTSFRSAFPNDLSEDLSAERGEAVLWAAAWITSFPKGFRDAVLLWGPTDVDGAREFVFRLAAHFGRDRSGSLFQVAGHSNDGIDVLEMLYILAMWAAPPEKDRVLADAEAYSPDLHDRASELRDSLIPAIASAKNQAAYEALHRLQLAATGPRQAYLRSVQFEMRELEAARPPVHQLAYGQFEETFRGDVTSFMAFAMAVHTDLLAVKYDIEYGEHSLRRFFSEVTFKGYYKKGAAGDEAGLALEADFQSLLASELNHHADRSYTVTVEPNTAESKRRDVLCSKDEWRASIELKMSMRWTLDQYIEALEMQLVGQYMRHANATVGFLVLVLQETGRKWRNPASGNWLDFQGVLAILRERANELERTGRARYLRIIGIDATMPPDFREKRQSHRRAY